METIFKPLMIEERILEFKKEFDLSMVSINREKKVICFRNKLILDRELEIIKKHYFDYIILNYERDEVEFTVTLDVLYNETIYNLESVKTVLQTLPNDWNDSNYYKFK